MENSAKDGQKMYGYSDDQMETLNKGQAKLVAEIGDVLNYRIIAEAVKSER